MNEIMPSSTAAKWRADDYKERMRLIALYTRAWYYTMMQGNMPFDLVP